MGPITVDKLESIKERWEMQDAKLMQDQKRAYNIMQHALEEQGHKRVAHGRDRPSQLQ